MQAILDIYDTEADFRLTRPPGPLIPPVDFMLTEIDILDAQLADPNVHLEQLQRTAAALRHLWMQRLYDDHRNPDSVEPGVDDLIVFDD